VQDDLKLGKTKSGCLGTESIEKEGLLHTEIDGKNTENPTLKGNYYDF
jgi:hypothetical protein